MSRSIEDFEQLHHQRQQQQHRQLRKSFLAAYSAYRRRDNHAEVFAAMIDGVLRRDLGEQLQTATRCLSIGTGTGQNELSFAAALMPSLDGFIGIEPDADSAAQLRQELGRRLSNVAEPSVCELPVERWNGPDKLVDVVLLFHVFYYWVENEARRQFCRRLFDWTAGGGLLVVLMDQHDEGPNGIHQLCRVPSGPGVREIPSYERVRGDLANAGFTVERQYEFRYHRDWSDPDPGLLRFVQLVRAVQMANMSSSSGSATDPAADDIGTSLDDIREAMRRLNVDRKTEGRTVLGIFRKPLLD